MVIQFAKVSPTAFTCAAMKPRPRTPTSIRANAPTAPVCESRMPSARTTNEAAPMPEMRPSP